MAEQSSFDLTILRLTKTHWTGHLGVQCQQHLPDHPLGQEFLHPRHPARLHRPSKLLLRKLSPSLSQKVDPSASCGIAPLVKSDTA